LGKVLLTHADVERALRPVRSHSENGLHDPVPRDTDAGVEDVLGPELDVVDAGVVWHLADLLGARVVLNHYQIDFLLAHESPSRRLASAS
jgi:hypothetical protein